MKESVIISLSVKNSSVIIWTDMNEQKHHNKNIMNVIHITNSWSIVKDYEIYSMGKILVFVFFWLEELFLYLLKKALMHDMTFSTISLHASLGHFLLNEIAPHFPGDWGEELFINWLFFSFVASLQSLELPLLLRLELLEWDTDRLFRKFCWWVLIGFVLPLKKNHMMICWSKKIWPLYLFIFVLWYRL